MRPPELAEGLLKKGVFTEKEERGALVEKEKKGRLLPAQKQRIFLASVQWDEKGRGGGEETAGSFREICRQKEKKGNYAGMGVEGPFSAPKGETKI